MFRVVHEMCASTSHDHRVKVRCTFLSLAKVEDTGEFVLDGNSVFGEVSEFLEILFPPPYKKKNTTVTTFKKL